jgi:caspase-like apoptosis-related cysteine protease
MPVERDSEFYNMNHKRRGLAIIFNHKTFISRSLDTRFGTDVDRDNLKRTMSGLGFTVRVYNDKKYTDIKKIVDEGKL